MKKGAKTVAVIGAGLSGMTVARRCAEAGLNVQLFEQQEQVGGLCLDEKDNHGILVHRFGPHYFRTDNKRLLTWLSQFSAWIPGHYFVSAEVDGRLIPLPVSFATLTALKGQVFDKMALTRYLEGQRVLRKTSATAEADCLARFGAELFAKIFKGYTEKQWGVSAARLSADITARIPLRFNWDEKYPNSYYQVMPRDGFSALFANLIDHARIKLQTQVCIKGPMLKNLRQDFQAVIYTGPVDKLYDFRFGRLPYRSLRLTWRHFNAPYVQPCVQINYPQTQAFTRSVEYKHITGQRCAGTTVSYEYPTSAGEPMYPLLNNKSLARLAKYAALAQKEELKACPLYCVGRLAEFRYWNMDQVILRAMVAAKKVQKDLR